MRRICRYLMKTGSICYYDDIQLYPFYKVELLRLIDELEVEGNKVREVLITSFKRAADAGIMTELEAADFVIYELNGEGDKSRNLAVLASGVINHRGAVSF